jgi:hypothetical protein
MMRTVANTYTMHFLDARKHFNRSAAMTEIRVEGYPKYIIKPSAKFQIILLRSVREYWLSLLNMLFSCVLTEMLLNINYHCTCGIWSFVCIVFHD